MKVCPWVLSRTRYSLLFVFMMLHVGVKKLQAAVVPPGFVDQPVTAGLTSPTGMAVSPDNRVFITQQNGTVRVVKGDQLLPEPFLRIPVDGTEERGLLGIAFHPDFLQNRFVYLYYTAREPVSHNVILRVTEENDVIQPGSEKIILELPPIPPGTRWHMGGAIHFGPDGLLYVAVGNHEDSPQANSFSQDLKSPFGKILRIHDDGRFPGDNPWLSGAEGHYAGNWTSGLRNPFSFGIHPKTGMVLINDVGQNTWEEINLGRPGANFGWPMAEGFGGAGDQPVYAYSHQEGCSIVGGAFYESETMQFPESYWGQYLFADFCQGWVRALNPQTWKAEDFVHGLNKPVALALAPEGSLYYLARNQDPGLPQPGAGSLGKISYTGRKVPRISRHPASLTVYRGESAAFDVEALDAESFQWQRNGVDIPGASAARYTLPQTTDADDRAVFRARVRNAHGESLSAAAALSITTNRKPQVFLEKPAASALFEGGQDIHFAGSALDFEDCPLKPEALTWQIDLHHDTHSHPFHPPTTGVSAGNVTIPDTDLTSANIWYRLYLTATDSAGARLTVARDIFPAMPLHLLEPVSASSGYGPYEKNTSNGGPEGGDGTPMVLNLVPYARGLGVHAPSELTYALNGRCQGQFIADIGIDDSLANKGSVIFRVWADQLEVFKSGIMRGLDRRQSLLVPLNGVQTLRLEVTDAGDGNAFDHANWGGARVTGCPQDLVTRR